MSMEQRLYRVLLASASQAMNAALSELPGASRFDRMDVVTDVGAARRAAAETPYDLVIVNAPLPDDPGIRFSIDLSSSGGSAVVLLMIRAEFYSEITDKVSPHGVFTVSKPTSRQTMEAALRWMMSARERLRKTETRTLTLEEKMAEIRIVNRAKWLLIEREGMDEPAAHRYLEKQAMDRCITRRAVAEEIIETYLALST